MLTLDGSNAHFPLGRQFRVTTGSVLQRIAATVTSGQSDVPAELELARPKELAAVPSSAVITGPEGKTCVLARLRRRSWPIAERRDGGLCLVNHDRNLGPQRVGEVDPTVALGPSHAAHDGGAF